MTYMVAIVALLVIVTISVVINRVATAALVATGVSPELATFQSRSVLTGVGFTTNEAEAITSHPARRRIVLVLMLASNAGIVTVIASLILGFSGTGLRGLLSRFGVLFAGLVLVLLLFRSDRFNDWLRRAIERALNRFTEYRVQDYASLLNVSGDYSVQEVRIRDGMWLESTSLGELELAREGVLVLGVRRRTGEFVGAPTSDLTLEEGDLAILYGREERLVGLSEREAGSEGEQEHEAAVSEQAKVREREREQDTGEHDIADYDPDWDQASRTDDG